MFPFFSQIDQATTDRIYCRCLRGADAPSLLPVVLDHLVWRSRLTVGGADGDRDRHVGHNNRSDLTHIMST